MAKTLMIFMISVLSVSAVSAAERIVVGEFFTNTS